MPACNTSSPRALARITRQEADLRKAAVEVEEKKRLEQRMLLDRIYLAMPGRRLTSAPALPPKQC